MPVKDLGVITTVEQRFRSVGLTPALHLRLHVSCRGYHRRAADNGAPAPPRSHAVCERVAVSGIQGDHVRSDAELFAQQSLHKGSVCLTVLVAAQPHAYLAVLHAYPRGLPWRYGGYEHEEAQPCSVALRFFPVLELRHRFSEERTRCVDLEAERGSEALCRGIDEAHFVRPLSDLIGKSVHHPFHEQCGLRSPRASIGALGGLIGHDGRRSHASLLYT